MAGCPGGRVKCIYNQNELPLSFTHIGKVAGNLIATDAQLELRLSPNAIPGDAFRFEPGTQYLGAMDGRTRLFSSQIGGLEKGRIYKYCFESKLRPSQKDYEQIATATLNYNFQGRKETVTQEIFINRSKNQSRYSMTEDEIAGWFSWLDGLRTNDPKAQMNSLKSQLKILLSEGADPEQIKLIKEAIDKLEKEGTLDGLSNIQKRRLRANPRTTIGRRN